MPVPKMTPAQQYAYTEALRRIKACRRSGDTSLDLNCFDLSSLPPEIGQLTALRELYLSGNRLTALPPEIWQLFALKALNLCNNRLTALPPEIAQLSALMQLDLSANRLTALPSEIAQLYDLRMLGLQRNGLIALPPEITQLSALTWLDLSGNRLTALPPEIAQLSSLMELYLGSNELTALPPELGKLHQLKVLILEGNALTALPESLREMSDLEELNLHENPALGLPTEVLGSWTEVDRNPPATPQAILDYYFALQRGAQPLNEAKVVLIGRGGAGKTTLRKALAREAIPEEEPRTDGIEISRLGLPIEEAVVGLNIWDFGGQEVMYSTHRFFLTSRTLYLLVLDARSGPQDENVDYWLRVVEELGKKAPTLLVLNHVDENPQLSLDESGWRQKYPFVVGEERTCAKRGGGVPELVEKMKAAIVMHLPEARGKFPKDWFAVKEALTEMKERLHRDHLSLREYHALCAQHKVPMEEWEGLLLLVRDLGLVSCYPEVPELKDLGVLRPGWLTTGIYALITSTEIKAKGARVRLGDVRRYLKERDSYAGHERFLLDAMTHFRLGFQEAPGTWLLTALLDENTPELTPWKQGEMLKLEMHYRVLPEGLVAQFIAQTHDLAGDPKLRWRNGVELQLDGTRALIQGDVPARHVSILVKGTQPRTLLTLIRREFRKINAGLTPPEERVPVPALGGEFVSYEDLLAAEAQGIKTLRLRDNAGVYREVEVGPLLNLYVEPGDLKEELAAMKSRTEEGFRRVEDGIEAVKEMLVTPRPVAQGKWWRSWVAVSALGGVILGALAVMWERWPKARTFLGAAVLGFVVVLLHNPARRFRRLFWSVLSGWALARAAGLVVKAHWLGGSIEWDGRVSGATDAVAALALGITGLLAWKEYQKEGH